jgi:hypothetical protein
LKEDKVKKRIAYKLLGIISDIYIKGGRHQNEQTSKEIKYRHCGRLPVAVLF